MRTILLRLAYDGTGFAGYQRQPEQRTVQETVERALEALHERRTVIHAAGRTDSGVHATGQYVSFESGRDSIPCASYPAAVNSLLPTDVRAVEAWEAPSGFHARFDARRRHYRYRIVVGAVTLPHLRSYAWRIPEMPDLDRLNRESAMVVGTHDFTTFAAKRVDQGSMVRTVAYAHWTRRGNELEFAIGADGFLWHMVRSIVGTVIERERNRLRGKPVGESIGRLLTAMDRGKAGTTAPAWGLFLHDVDYDRWGDREE